MGQPEGEGGGAKHTGPVRVCSHRTETDVRRAFLYLSVSVGVCLTDKQPDRGRWREEEEGEEEGGCVCV